MRVSFFLEPAVAQTEPEMISAELPCVNQPERAGPKTATAHPCPVCSSTAHVPSAEKFKTQYFSCNDCHAIFAEGIDPGIIQTHNDAPETRTDTALQEVRLQRSLSHLGRRPEKILDFGCGRGDYISFLNERGLQATGVDQDTQAKLTDFAPQSFDIVNMVEVIEHLGNPIEIMKQLADLLTPGGIIYGESSFVDFIGPPEHCSYVDPRIGHCCIHSQRSIGYLSKKLAMRTIWINNNVFIMQKNAPD